MVGIFSGRKGKKENHILYTPDSSETAKKVVIPDDVLFDSELEKLKPYLELGAPGFSIGQVPDPESYSKFDGKLRLESHQIKMPGSKTHTIPPQCAHLMGAIRTIIDFEAANSELFEDKTALLTVRQFNLAAGKQQNSIEWHRDRVGRIYDEKPDYSMTDHIYIVSDVDPARVQMHTMKDAFQRLATGQALEGGDFRQVDPYEVILMTNYCHHAPGRMSETGVRTFIQLIYTGPSDERMKNYQDRNSARRALNP